MNPMKFSMTKRCRRKDPFSILWAIFLILVMYGCKDQMGDGKPNVILIMSDDMGYECLSCYGGRSYQTPVIDRLAENGVLFNQCIAQPLCTPSRVKIMTGFYNYRNYDYFGHLKTEAYTFGNLMRDAGYATCVVGKWQLNGLAYKEEIPYWNDASRPYQFGFDEYCLWQLTKTRAEGERYADPLVEQNGLVLETDSDDYGPDIFTEYILNFIDRKQDVPFFIYYPMVLVHEPFVPTPDSEAWEDPSLRYKKDTAYFRDMVAYTDKIVGRITDKLTELRLLENTIIIFTGDNGTHPSIYTNTRQGIIQGGKGNTIDAGIHVPLIVHWPGKIKKGFEYDGLIEFSDFFPTFAEIAGTELAEVPGTDMEVDGKSFYPLLTGEAYEERSTVFVHYDPRWGTSVNQYRNQFVQSASYKLYQDGKFFNLSSDILEKHPLAPEQLTDNETEIREALRQELKRHPVWRP